MKQGKFITLEGGEGVGKSTNLRYIQEWFQQRHVPILVTREPGGTEIAESIRHLLLNKSTESLTENAELLLVFAARAQHIEHVIKPALFSGQWVLSDRFTDATYAYQGGGRQMSLSTIALLENLVQEGLNPDMTLLLDANVETGMERVRNRGELDRFESESQSFFHRVRNGYQKRMESDPKRFRCVDATQPLDKVQQDIDVILSNLYQVEMG